jgi:hypothetical protein
MSEMFSEADLAPSDDDRREARADLLDRAAASVGALSAGALVGGLFAMGACAAPMVFRVVPAPASGLAMGGAFARFDRVAIGCACVALGAEVVRTFLARRSAPSLAARARRLVAIGLAAAATWMGTSVSPAILDLYAAGARRGVGDEGAALEAIHQKATTIGNLEALLGAALVALHVSTRRGPARDEEHVADAPLPPGPRD